MPALDTKAGRAGFALEHRRTVGSTSAELVERARGGETGPLWLVAHQQPAGRGRRERQWRSPKGNLYASLLLSDPGPPESVAQLSLVFALALRDAVVGVDGPKSATAQVKWPNDLMLGGRKCAGLLLEGGSAKGLRFVVAGFGVNIASHPEATAHKATDLQSEEYMTDRDTLFELLGAAVQDRLTVWNRGQGLPAIRADWLRHAYGLGQPMRIATATESYVATLRGVDPAGRLIVERDGVELIVSAGEVFDLEGEPERAR
ncbi:MAG: biotin--[acetyl-CoA-carboxylase] ligase [Cucumibacter sp.]